MVKKNGVSAGTSALAVAVAMAAISLGLGGCAAATAKPATDKARLTGYASATMSRGSSGPVSVELNGASVARLDQLVNGLQKWTGSSCIEETQLYQLDVTQIAGAKRSVEVAGDECANLVYITSHGTTVTKVDGNCALLRAVRRLLPPTAKATQQLTPPNCDS